jgi:hypothetical protein
MISTRIQFAKSAKRWASIVQIYPDRRVASDTPQRHPGIARPKEQTALQPNFAKARCRFDADQYEGSVCMTT